jgi:TPR repeat protein
MTATAPDFIKGLAAAKRGDYATALREWQPLADQGNARAQYYVGAMYFEGNGVTKNFDKAAEWFRKAADQGDVNAQPSLGAMYAKGLGVPQDYTKAMKWYRKAAEEGFAESQVNLGLAYYDGQGVPQDHATAHMWFSLAAENGDKEGAKARDLLAKSMTPAQIAKARKLAREWLEKHKKK